MLASDREQRLDELQALHSSLVLTVVQRHGVSAAMRLIGQTLTWLATLPSDGALNGMGSGPPQSPRSRFAESTETARERWHRAVELALGSPDPWAAWAAERCPPLSRAARLQLVDSNWVREDLLVRCEREPFTRGAMRHCHRVRVLLGPGRRPLNFVAKRYDPPDRRALEDDVRVQLRAKSYAKLYVSRGVPKAIDYLHSFLLDVDGLGCFAAEALLEPGAAGEFIKFSSNSGFVTDELVRNTPHAFSHFTFEESGGREMVVDVQGVGDLFTDPQIHTIDGYGYGRGNMGVRGIALFFASHRCNAICRRLQCTPFNHSPDHGSGTVPAARSALPAGGALSSPMPLRNGRGGMSIGETRLDERALLMPPPPPVAGDLSPPTSVAAAPTRYAPVHLALALLHARHVHAGDEIFGFGLFASPAQGLFHLRSAAEQPCVPLLPENVPRCDPPLAQGSVSAMLSLSCLHHGVKPRKGVLRVLAQALQQPLGVDAAAGVAYTIFAAERGVVGAMAAAGHAYRWGKGVAPSYAKAARWFRAAVNAYGGGETSREDEEDEAARLPGGDATEAQMLFQLAEIYERGGPGVPANARLARQFELLSRAAASRDGAAHSDGDEADGLGGAEALPRKGMVCV